jgi:Mg/Co/Ni transporter MgtE
MKYRDINLVEAEVDPETDRNIRSQILAKTSFHAIQIVIDNKQDFGDYADDVVATMLQRTATDFNRLGYSYNSIKSPTDKILQVTEDEEGDCLTMEGLKVLAGIEKD